MKKNILTFVFSTMATLLAAQNFEDIAPCGVHLLQQINSSWESDENLVQSSFDNTEKVIPVVFHIFHESGFENVSRENILLALERLNKDFNKNHENLPQTPTVFSNIAADIEVQFVLATKDPQGNCTDGINRYFTNLTALQLQNSLNLSQFLWDDNRYLNVFVSRTLASGNTLSLGYGVFPGFNPPYGNAIFLSHEVMLFSEQGIYADESITHEVGHWLDLRHVWGDTGGNVHNCGDTDGITDTPNQLGPSRKCFQDFPFITCNNGPNGNMFCNFMDYGSKGCLTMFTNGQKNRMQTILNFTSDRKNLWTPVNLDSTGANAWTPAFSCPATPEADFALDKPYFIYCEPNIEVKFEERCFKGAVDTLQWLFPGGTPNTASSSEVSVSYPNEGQYSVTLIASNQFGSDTITRTITISAIDGTPYAVGSNGEDFENANTIEDVGAVFQILGGVNFKVSNAAGYNSNKSIECKQGFGEYFRLHFVTKKFAIGQQDSIFSFYLSHRGEEVIRDKYIQVIASYNCRDRSVEQYIGLLYGDETETTNIGSPFSVFIPNSPDQWEEINFVIPSQFRGRDDVQFQFNYFADRTNNLYIDNIRVKSNLTTALNEPEKKENWNIFPNPVDNELTVECNCSKSNQTILNIYDVSGRLVLSRSINKDTDRVQLSGMLPYGIYFCKLIDDQGLQIGDPKKLIKN